MEHEGEHGGGGAEVDEGRGAELAGYVDRDGGREVQDQGGHVGGRGEGRHGGPDARLAVLDVTGDEVVGADGFRAEALHAPLLCAGLTKDERMFLPRKATVRDALPMKAA
ncbi:hypothetical protein MUK42_34062 [Musa troglodytarum]|uniref:Uncharacterized protein n=1 Tax=Musa troglodytarum TaxID=320322 RepID=A0A9E7JX07_9LILI|nr:hypothetical protein MUK42_34062 [Musa troglodytarum]